MIYKMRSEYTPTFDSFSKILDGVKSGTEDRCSVPIEIVQSLCRRALEDNKPWDAQRIAQAAIENSEVIEFFDQKLLNTYAGIAEKSQGMIRSNGNGH